MIQHKIRGNSLLTQSNNEAHVIDTLMPHRPSRIEIKTSTGIIRNIKKTGVEAWAENGEIRSRIYLMLNK